MHIQDIKRWHWAAIAIVIGLAVSYVWSSSPNDQRYRTIEPAQFERGLILPPRTVGHIDKIRVLPASDQHNEIICTQIERSFHGARFTRTVAALAGIPYRSIRTGKSYSNVLEFLAAARKTHPQIQFSYAWYRQIWVTYLLCTGASLLLIGGIWPSIVSLLTGGGLGFARAPKEPEYDLDRFSTGEKSEAPRAAPVIDAEDMDQVRQLDQELEKNLAATAAPSKSGAPAAPVATSEQPIRKLEGGPLEAAEAQKDDLEKEYGGEYYPVVKSIHKKDENPPKPE